MKRESKLFSITIYRELGNSRTEDNALKAIARCCRALECAHDLPDGNQRTIAFLELNKFLIEAGFTPCILSDPTVFDGYRSDRELVEDIKEGMENFKKFLKPTPPS